MGKLSKYETEPYTTHRTPCCNGDRLLDKLLLLMGCLCLVGFVSLYQMQLVRDTEMRWMKEELAILRQACVVKNEPSKVQVAENVHAPEENTAEQRRKDDEPTIVNVQKSSFGEVLVPGGKENAHSYPFGGFEKIWSLQSLRIRSHLARHRSKRSAARSHLDTQEEELGVSRDKPGKLNSNSTQEDIIQAVRKLQRAFKRSKRTNAIHLTAYIDRDLHVRQDPQDRKGHYQKGTFYIKKRIFNIWQVASWSDRRLFKHYDDSGKVKVKETGIYLIYAQIVLPGESLRKSIAIHVDDEIQPLVEHVTMNRRTRIRRDFQESASANSTNILTGSGDTRARRHSVYTHANLMAVACIEKGQQVFIRSERPRGVAMAEHLTYWGIAKLN